LSQSWYIWVNFGIFWWPYDGQYWLVIFLLKICIWSIPLHIIVPLIPPNHQFRVPSVTEIDFFFEQIIIRKEISAKLGTLNWWLGDISGTMMGRGIDQMHISNKNITNQFWPSWSHQNIPKLTWIYQDWLNFCYFLEVYGSEVTLESNNWVRSGYKTQNKIFRANKMYWRLRTNVFYHNYNKCSCIVSPGLHRDFCVEPPA